MIEKLFAELLARVPPAQRQADLDKAVQQWAKRAAAIVAPATYRRKAVLNLHQSAALATRLLAVDGYREFGSAITGFLCALPGGGGVGDVEIVPGGVPPGNDPLAARAGHPEDRV